MIEAVDRTEPALLSDADIVAAIRAATDELFSTMLGMEITSAEAMAPEAVTAAPASGIISVIGLAGKWAGTGSVACSGGFACLMSSKFLMTEYTAVNEDVLDAIAEITNMIIGNVKTILEEKVGAMGLSTPTVIFGRNFHTRSVRNQEWTGVRFMHGEHAMAVQMCLAPNREAAERTLRPGFHFPSAIGI